MSPLAAIGFLVLCALALIFVVVTILLDSPRRRDDDKDKP